MKNRLLYTMDRVLETALVATTIVMVLVVLLQILARFALPWTPHWTEEVARLCFIYMVSLGAGLAVKERAYVNVTTFLRQLPDRARFYLESVILLSTFLLMLVMFLSGFPLLSLVKLQTSAALQINMVFIYAAMLVMSLTVMIYALLQFIEMIRLR